jgi:amidophosphoribosyltransferase
LIAHHRTEEEIAKILGADGLIYQDLEDLIEAARKGNPALTRFDTSCFSGQYVTGDVNQGYLEHLALQRSDEAKSRREGSSNKLVDLQIIT